MRTPVPRLEQVQKHSVRFAILGVAGFVVLILVAVILAVFLWPKHNRPVADVLKQAQNLDSHGFHQQAIDLATPALKYANKTEKQSIYGELVAINMNSGDFARALAMTRESEKLKPSYYGYMQEAYLLTQMKDKAGAIAAYKKAQDAAKTDTVAQGSPDLPSIPSLIKQLEDGK